MTDKPEDTGLDKLSAAERDRVDLNRELLGANTSRQTRFFPGDATDLYGDSEKAKSEHAYRSLLEMLLSEDPYYAELYNRVSEKLDRAERAVDNALSDINQRLETSGQALAAMRENAATLEDGTKVFLSKKDGHLYTEDGVQLSDEDAKSISIPDDAPSWEDYSAQRQTQDEALRQREEVERYQRDVLDPLKKRLRDPDNVFSKEELEEVDRNFGSDMPPIMRGDYDAHAPIGAAPDASVSPDQGSAPPITGETDISNMPEMGKAFDLAHAGTTEPPLAPEPAPVSPLPSSTPRTLG